MKKRWMIIGTGVVATLVLAGSVFASSSGYDTYKDALKNMMTVQNAQLEVKMAVSDNGNSLMKADGTMKLDHETKDASGMMKLESTEGTKEFEFYKNRTQHVYHELGTDVYKTGNPDCETGCSRGEQMHSPEQLQNMERMADILLTGVRNQVEMKASTDGGSDITLDLNENQIPETLNVMAALKGSHGGRMGHGSRMDSGCDRELAALHSEVPELVTDVKIQKLYLQAHLTPDQLIESQTVSFTITGRDAEGTEHTQTVEGTMRLSGFNTTEPEVIDLTGKNVVTCTQSAE